MAEKEPADQADAIESFIATDHATDEGIEANAVKLYDFPGKKRSIVWTHFGFEKKGDRLNMEFAVCKICRKKYTNNSKFE